MTPSQNLNSEEVERGKNVPSVIGVLSLDLDVDSVNILKELLASSSNEGMIDGEVRLAVLLILSVLQSPFLSWLFAISLRVSWSTSANQWFQMWYTNRLWRKKTLYRLLHTFFDPNFIRKEFSSKNFRLRNISYSCTYNSSLINESLMLQHYRITFNHKRHFAIKLLRDMSVVRILFRFIKNSANQLYSVKVDFHCCVIFTFVRFYILLYFTNATVEIHLNFVRPKLSV